MPIPLPLPLALLSACSSPMPEPAGPPGAVELEPSPTVALADPEALAADRPERGTLFRPHRKLATLAPARGEQPREPHGGEAVAVFDIDVDGLLDVVIVNGQNRVYAFRNEQRARTFTLRETPIGPDDDGLLYEAKGLGLHDFDRDGALDLWLGTQGPGAPIVYKADERIGADAGLYRRAEYVSRRNTRNGAFPFGELGLRGAGGQRALVVDDWDGDGEVDAFRSNSAYYGDHYSGGTEGSALQVGTGKGRFGEDVIADVLLDGPEDFWTNAKGESEKNFKATISRDLDGDGRPDLIMGAFADIWANYRAETISGGYGWQGTWARGVFLLHNQSQPGRIRFREVAHQALGPWAWNTTDAAPVHAIVAADIDGDADLDLIMTGYKGVNGHGTLEHDTPILRVLRNESRPGELRFVDVTSTSGLDVLNHDDTLPSPYPIDMIHLGARVRLYPAMLEGGAFDVDNDGDVDILMAERQVVRGDRERGESFGLYAWLFLNDGTGRFTIVPGTDHGIDGTSRALSYGDFDADGRLDLVVVDGSGGGQFVTDTNRVYLNAIDNGNGWVSVEATVPHDPWGIGTTVTVRREADGRVLGHDEIRTDFCYRSKRDASVHVGTGDAQRVTVEMKLPDGRTALCPAVEPGRRLRLVVPADPEKPPGLKARDAGAPRDRDTPYVRCELR